jgi:tetratricopeptide (TPR) repeat protein
MYAFNPEEASYHFVRAAQFDPHLAMAYWGVALAAGPNINTSYELKRAQVGRDAIALARNSLRWAAPEERAYIEALAPRYAGVTQAERIAPAQRAYADAMGVLAQRFPNDLDATVLYAESLMDLTPLRMWGHDGTAGPNTRRVIALLDAVVRRDRNHVGANHLLIHAWEDSPEPQAALPAARALMTADLPPGAEHLAHMPAHIFTRVGDYDDAIRASLRTIALFRQFLPIEHSGIHNAYYHHDYQVLNYAYMMSGQWANARDAAVQIANQVDDNAAGVETYLRFHKWQELLALTAPQQPDIRWRFAHALASAATGNVGEAQAALQTFDAAHDTDARTGIARESLAAEVATVQHRDRDAIDDLRRAVVLDDRLPSREPPAWFYPLRETLGARLIIAGRYAEAQHVFEDDLRRNPNNPRSLFGLSKALEKTAPERARAATEAFQRAWSHADVSLSLDDM